MKHNFYVLYENVLLRPLEVWDIEYLRMWRNDTSNTKFLSKIGNITPEQQLNWFQKYLNDESEIIFAIEEIGKIKNIVGSVSLYDIRDGIAEVGKILIGDKNANGMGIGRKALVMTMAVGFEKLGIEKIVGSVHPDNVQAYTNDMKIGFTVTGEHPFEGGGYEHEIEIDREHLKAANPYVKDLIIRGEYSKYYIGQEATFSKTFSEQDVYQFAGISGDFNAIHINEIEAEKSIFRKRVCHGMLTASLISACIGTKMPGEGSIYLNQSLNFRKPVYIGDTCTAKVRVEKIVLEKKILELSTCVYNQNDEMVIEGSAVVKVKRL